MDFFLSKINKKQHICKKNQIFIKYFNQNEKYFKKKRYLLMLNKKMMYLCIEFELQNKHVKLLKVKRNEKSIFIFCSSFSIRILRS